MRPYAAVRRATRGAAPASLPAVSPTRETPTATTRTEAA